MVNGLVLGSIYALIALGYTMVYGVLKLINFAHGEIFAAGAFAGYFALKLLHVPWPVAMLIAMAASALLGVVIERCAYRPLRRAPRLAALITAIGVSLFLQNLGVLTLGASPRGYPPALEMQKLAAAKEHLNIIVTNQQLLIMGLTIALWLVLRFVVSRTRLGRAMRAVAHDKEAAQLMGINVDSVIAATFAIGSAFGAVAGVMYGIYYNTIDPLMGYIPGIKAFVAAVLGGIGNITGALLGGMLMGVVETIVSSQTLHLPGGIEIVGSTLRDAVAFAVLIGVLLVRPTGIMGKREAG